MEERECVLENVVERVWESVGERVCGRESVWERVCVGERECVGESV